MSNSKIGCNNTGQESNLCRHRQKNYLAENMDNHGQVAQLLSGNENACIKRETKQTEKKTYCTEWMISILLTQRHCDHIPCFSNTLKLGRLTNLIWPWCISNPTINVETGNQFGGGDYFAWSCNLCWNQSWNVNGIITFQVHQWQMYHAPYNWCPFMWPMTIYTTCHSRM